MINRLACALFVASMIGATSAQAATVDLRTFNRIGPDILQDTGSYPFTIPSSTLSSNLVANDTGDTSNANSGFDNNGKRLSAGASLFRPTQSEFVNYRAAGFATAKEQITVLSGGTLFVTLNFTGSFSSLTDLPETDGFASVSANLDITGLGLPIEREFRRASSDIKKSDMFTDRIFAEFAVEAGDVFDVTAQLIAVNGSTGDITAFIETSSSILGAWSILGRDGAVIEKDPIDVTPVPLPASLPLLFGGVLGMCLLHRGAQKQAG